MFALLAINGDSPNVRVIAVSPTKEPLKRFITKGNTYWWTGAGGSIDTPKLTWRHPEFDKSIHKFNDDIEVALFRGNLFGKSVTELQIRVVEMTGILK